MHRIFLIISLFLFACSTGKHPHSHEKQVITLYPETSLTREGALSRFKQIQKVNYRLWFHLDSENQSFQGKAIIFFDLKPHAKDFGNQIVIDLEGGSLSSIQLNGHSITNVHSPERFDQHHLYFNLSELQSSSNQIEISYTHPYSTDGYGLHRFKDPIDQEIYVYSNFEPYSAHRLFPCFDQPDLKATFELTVEAPDHWKVISTHRETTISDLPGKQKSWTFPPTKLLSPYVFSLIAGPYYSWKSDAEEIPLQLFARKSLAQYVEAKEWFDVTRQGFDFFEVEFGLPYPFEKYDQIIVPEFNAGAMENVGAVTFSENYIFRSPTTQDRHRRRADTILHEMSHMWFGDLVTMKWWNGLWLNESFATFMAAQAISKATQFSKGNWESFFTGLKVPAYEEDQWVTTHPIELPVHDTHQAETIFDSITYGKGASVLKQMSFYLGEENFREGIQRYFSKFAFQNTTLADFTHMQSEASAEDLSHWQRNWLTTTGMNTIEAIWKCSTDSPHPKVTQFELIQSAEPTASLTHKNLLRKHKTQIALFHFPKRHQNSASFQLSKVIPVTFSNDRTSVEEALGAKCPSFVFLNYEDQDYSKIVLDASSLSLMSNHVSQLPDSLTRLMVWHSFWQMVVDGKIRAQNYADFFMNQKFLENNTQVLSFVLKNLVSPSLHTDSIIKFLDPSIVTPYKQKLETFFKKRLLHSRPKSDLQKVWFSSYVSVAFSKSSGTFLKTLLTGKRKLKGLVIDQDRRWEIIGALGRMGDPDIQNLLNKELKADPTNIGEENAIAIRASLPNTESKNTWLKHILREDSQLPLAKLRKAMSNFNIVGQEDFVRGNRQFYFQTLEKLYSSSSVEDQNYLQYFAKLMFPSACDPQTPELVEAFMKEHPSLPPVVIKNLKVGSQLEQRCVKARSKSIS